MLPRNIRIEPATDSDDVAPSHAGSFAIPLT